ncbi:MAG: response regulator [Myxococcales bacterium]|nr:response regulator [Myxococcales bacterium]HIK84710.1 response regulator [Myxococcales bacterium]
MAKVLVIDECSEFREWATGELLRNGFSVIVARDGLAGLQRAVEDAPDWVLIDAGLSIQGGEEICRRLRGDDSTRDLRIAIWSSHSDEDQEIAALAAGADVFLLRSRQTANLGEQGRTLLGSRLPAGLFAIALDRGGDSEPPLESFALASAAGRR